MMWQRFRTQVSTAAGVYPTATERWSPVYQTLFILDHVSNGNKFSPALFLAMNKTHDKCETNTMIFEPHTFLDTFSFWN